jgi:3-oxoacyl-[acyl-carrier protein] reductase
MERVVVQASPSGRGEELSGQVILVTGGSRGIGAACARAFAESGARVIITHRDSAEGAAEVLASLTGDGHRVVRASAADTPALEEAARSVRDTEGRLDVLVNNAATTRVIPHGDLNALDDDFFDLVLQTNVRGPFATVRAFRPLLDADGGGVVVNISSLAAKEANGSNVAYCASKAALDNMTLSLARALAPGIRVLSVAPGLIDTVLTRGWDPERRQRMIERTPLGRLAEPEDVAEAVMAAVTHLPMSTGIVIPVDGGRPLGR